MAKKLSKRQEAATAKAKAAAKAKAHSDLVSRGSRVAYAAVSEIGPIPPVARPKRKKRCRLNLLAFLTTYFPHSTGLRPFSKDHHRVIASIQDAILHGGRLVNAVYREFAKTTITENSLIWAALYGHRKFGLVTGVNLAASTANIESIKSELAENDLLLEDFPEVCFPVQALENRPQRCASQSCNGESTAMTWRADVLVLPTIPKSLASGNIITAKPYAKARGVKFKRSDGANARPDLILVDDPQDDESAVSPMQVKKNLGILKKNLIHTADHNRQLAIVVNGTVIAKNDMIEALLADTAWQGERIKFMQSKASLHDSFWLKEYATVRRTFDRSTQGDKQRAEREATALYASKRTQADAGCIVSWPERYNRPIELSAIQHAYNVIIDDGPEVFASEYQNEPLDERAGQSKLTAAMVSSKTNGLARGVVPSGAHHLVCYVDVHGRLLYYVVTAFAQDYSTFSVVDYGTYPRQPLAYFAQKSAPASMEDAAKKSGISGSEEAWIHAALGRLTDQILGARFHREDGAEMQVGKLFVDARWGNSTVLVKAFCRRNPAYPVRIFPAQGYGSGPTKPPLNSLPLKPGTRAGDGWRVAPATAGDQWITIDANQWKTFVNNRLCLPFAAKGSVDLFGLDPREHALFADHCISEYSEEIYMKGRDLTMTVWQWPLPHSDNHYWDCLVGSAVGASMLGCQVPGTERRVKSRRMTAGEMAAIARR